MHLNIHYRQKVRAVAHRELHYNLGQVNELHKPADFEEFRLIVQLQQ